ncbi:hypothetical protein J3E68DRAFT_127169 [Trichoderma sp. SZMC 28012]
MADENNNSGVVCVDTASSTTEGRLTPSTIMSEETSPSHGTYARHIEHLPMERKMCILRTRQEPRRFLGIQCGKLKFFEIPVKGSEIFWYCVKDGNFFGFWNLNCGTYLGHDGAGRMVVTSTHHRTAQYFIPVRQENGGYILHTFHPERKELLQVGEDDTRSFLIERRKGGLAFDFIDSQYVTYSVTLALPNMEVERLGPKF